VHFGQCPMQIFNQPHPSRGNVSMSTRRVGLPRSLSTTFHDFSTSAQQKRQWEPEVVHPLGFTPLQHIKILPERLIAINALGVIEMHHWKLVAKEEPKLNSTEPNRKVASMFATTPKELNSPYLNAEDEGDGFLNTNGISTPNQCSWTLQIERDNTPFDIVPRLPVTENQKIFPVQISDNGRVVINGGCPTGAIDIRLIDLETGHVIGKASVDGHDDIVTCLSLDLMLYEDGEILLSGSR